MKNNIASFVVTMVVVTFYQVQVTFAQSVDFGGYYAEDPPQEAKSTLLDPSFDVVKAVLQGLNGTDPGYDRVCQLMEVGFNLPTVRHHSLKPQDPEITAKMGGDCKDKALWLAKEINDPNVVVVCGDGTQRFVLVKHVWLEYKHSGVWWILDCTLRDRPVMRNSISSQEYTPYWSYTSGHEYEHQLGKWADTFGWGTTAALQP